MKYTPHVGHTASASQYPKGHIKAGERYFFRYFNDYKKQYTI